MNRIPTKELKVESEAKLPDIMLKNINSIVANLADEKEDNGLIAQLQELGLYEEFRERRKQSENEIKTFLKPQRQQVDQV